MLQTDSVQKYSKRRQSRPEKEGPTSILQVINEKLQEAGLRDSNSVAALKASKQSKRSAQARYRSQKISSKTSLKRGRRANEGRGKHVLTAGSRVRQELVEARAVAVREHAKKAKRRTAFLCTMRATAQNRLLQLKAGKVAEDLRKNRASSEKKELFDADIPREVKMKYFPGRNIPCMLIDNVYVPAVKRHDYSDTLGNAAQVPHWAHDYQYWQYGKRYCKLKKFLNLRDWQPRTDHRKLVLPNGMSLWSVRRRIAENETA